MYGSKEQHIEFSERGEEKELFDDLYLNQEEYERFEKTTKDTKDEFDGGKELSKPPF